MSFRGGATSTELKFLKNKLVTKLVIDPGAVDLNLFVQMQISIHFDLSSYYQIETYQILINHKQLYGVSAFIVALAIAELRINLKLKRLS